METSNLIDLLKDFEKSADATKAELSELKCTMIVNFNGRKGNPKLLDGSEKTALQMFLKIVTYYHDELEKLKDNLVKFKTSELKFRREMRGFSLREVEKLTGISNAYLSQLENGKIKNPSYEVVIKLTNVYY